MRERAWKRVRFVGRHHSIADERKQGYLFANGAPGMLLCAMIVQFIEIGKTGIRFAGTAIREL